MFVEILSWTLFGLVAGGLAKFIMPGKDPGGCLVTALLGIAGAWVGGLIGRVVFHRGVSGFNLMSLLLAIAGAVLLLVLYRAVIGRRAPR